MKDCTEIYKSKIPRNMPEFPEGKDLIYDENTGFWYLQKHTEYGSLIVFSKDKKVLEQYRDKS